jgi:hypothetical protein
VSPRTRFTLWVAAVGGCTLSPILWHTIAPWAGAAWQCLCLGAIIALYATTPPDAIRLSRWASKAIILAGMVAWPVLCYRHVTWALVVATLVVAAFDHVPLTFTRQEDKGIHISARWSSRPGVAADWLMTPVMWSPVMWVILSGSRSFALPEWSIPASFYCLMFMFVFQMPEEFSRPARPPIIPQRVGMAAVFLAVGVGAVVGYAMHGGGL